jgi:Meckel syndrome type 1 protein
MIQPTALLSVTPPSPAGVAASTSDGVAFAASLTTMLALQPSPGQPVAVPGNLLPTPAAPDALVPPMPDGEPVAMAPIALSVLPEAVANKEVQTSGEVPPADTSLRIVPTSFVRPQTRDAHVLKAKAGDGAPGADLVGELRRDDVDPSYFPAPAQQPIVLLDSPAAAAMPPPAAVSREAPVLRDGPAAALPEAAAALPMASILPVAPIAQLEPAVNAQPVEASTVARPDAGGAAPAAALPRVQAPPAKEDPQSDRAEAAPPEAAQVAPDRSVASKRESASQQPQAAPAIPAEPDRVLTEGSAPELGGTIAPDRLTPTAVSATIAPIASATPIPVSSPGAARAITIPAVAEPLTKGQAGIPTLPSRSSLPTRAASVDRPFPADDRPTAPAASAAAPRPAVTTDGPAPVPAEQTAASTAFTTGSMPDRDRWRALAPSDALRPVAARAQQAAMSTIATPIGAAPPTPAPAASLPARPASIAIPAEAVATSYAPTGILGPSPALASAPVIAVPSAVPASAAPEIPRIGAESSAAIVIPGPVASAQPMPVVAGATAPAFRLFAAAIHAARRDERNDAVLTPAPMTGIDQTRAPHVAAVTEGTPLDMGNRHWPQQMVERIEGLRDAASAMRDAASTSIRLVPDALGTIKVAVRTDGDTVHVHFTAEQAATRTLIADAQPRLTELAEARGIKLAQADVGTGFGAGDQKQTSARPTRPADAPPSAVHDDEPEIATIRVA